MKSIALITDESNPGLTEDDRLLVPLFKEKGIDALGVRWDSPGVEWEKFDLCIIRSTWDYFTRFQEFLAWLDRLEQRKVNIRNRIPTIRWNYHKSYLKMLEAKGIPIIPTLLIQSVENADLKSLLETQHWENVVLKPCISAASYRTHKFHAGEAQKHQLEFEDLLHNTGALIQPYLPEIKSNGEWSFLFFDREFSHAVLKKPAVGEFRSQESYGGSITLMKPEQSRIEQARRVLGAIDDDLLYARIDMIESDGRMLLVEMELIEPTLYFISDPASPVAFVEKVISRFMR